ncbi:peptidyl-alpha-hydroxyglycine alpha-amidating lyase family protein [soil metagenome]
MKLIPSILIILLTWIYAFPQVTKLPELGYKPAPDSLLLPAGMNFGEVAGVAINSKGHILVFHRGSRPLVEFDSSGKFVRTLCDGLFKSAHGLRIDANDNIWITDIGSHLVLKLNSEGRVLMVLGKVDWAGDFSEPRYGLPLFNMPTDVAFGPAGDIFVSDGYGNSRVMKFDKDGRFIKIWGKKGKAPGEFDLPHAIGVDNTGLVYVGDRENQRIQIFDSDGKFIKEWTNVGYPYGITITPDQSLYVADGKNERLLKMNLSGEILGVVGEPGKGAGQFGWAHSVAVSPTGEIYVAEILNWRVQKFVKR